MDSQILEVALRDHRTDDVGQAADAQLQAGPVFDLLDDVLADLPIDLAELLRRNVGQRRVRAFDDVVDARDVHRLLGCRPSSAVRTHWFRR